MKTLTTISLIVFSFTLSRCGDEAPKKPPQEGEGKSENTQPANTNSQDPQSPAVSYESNIKPMIQNSCLNAGCHQSGGQNLVLDSYDAVRIEHERVLKSIGPKGNMPITGDRLSSEQIQEFEKWKSDGFQQ